VTISVISKQQILDFIQRYMMHGGVAYK